MLAHTYYSDHPDLAGAGRGRRSKFRLQAARARDRKAYELHGDRAYLNLPDEIRR